MGDGPTGGVGSGRRGEAMAEELVAGCTAATEDHRESDPFRHLAPRGPRLPPFGNHACDSSRGHARLRGRLHAWGVGLNLPAEFAAQTAKDVSHLRRQTACPHRTSRFSNPFSRTAGFCSLQSAEAATRHLPPAGTPLPLTVSDHPQKRPQARRPVSRIVNLFLPWPGTTISSKVIY